MWFILPFSGVLHGALLLLFSVTEISMLPFTSDSVQVHRYYSKHFKLLQGAKYNVSTNQSYGCLLPTYDPTIMRFVKTYQLFCPSEPYLTYIDVHGYIHLNTSGFDSINKTFKDVQCEFQTLSSIAGKKRKFLRGKNIQITVKPLKVNGDIIKVKCVDMKKNKLYETCHFYILPPTKKKLKKNVKLQKQGRTNILLLAIDSVSQLSFEKSMPNTYGFLTSQLHSVIMKGLTKIGLFSEQNMIPFLSGYKMFERDNNSTPAFCKNEALCTMYFDDKPIVWKNFSRAGYVTMWLDEWLERQLFDFREKWFKKKPTNYFPRPLIQGLEKIGTTNNGFCFGNTPTFDVVLDYTEKFVKAMNDTLYFAFPFIAGISHDDAKTVPSMDSSLYGFLERLYSTGKLDNTILVLFGDHGLRFGPIRNTLIGAVEDRMPFMSIYLPKRLREQKPHLQAGLEVNSARVMSWFDMYEMLMDLVMDNLEVVSRVPRWGFSVGLSPFRPFPENRTCQEAGIPLEDCICMTPVDIAITNEGISEMAEEVIKFVNSKLENIPNRPCAELVLDRVESAQIITNPIYEGTLGGLVERLRITVWTLPNNALFQATLERRVRDQKGKVLGYVERLNTYENQSVCLESYPDRKVHPYCFCVKV